MRFIFLVHLVNEPKKRNAQKFCFQKLSHTCQQTFQNNFEHSGQSFDLASFLRNEKAFTLQKLDRNGW